MPDIGGSCRRGGGSLEGPSPVSARLAAFAACSRARPGRQPGQSKHAEDLASKETSLLSFEEVSGFGTLAMDLIDADSIDKATVNADLATLTDECK